MNVSENRVKFAGSHVEVPFAFELGTSVAFSGEGEITQIHQRNNDDGTCIQIHILRPKLVDLEALEGQSKGEVYTAKTVGKSPSQRLRDTIYLYWEQEMKFKYPNFQVYYESYIEKQIDKIKENLL